MEIVTSKDGLKQIAIQLKIYMELHLKASSSKDIKDEDVELQ
jgi:hypothetical protein